MVNSLIIWIAVAVAVVIFILLISYVKTSPNIALVISGWPRKKPKFLVGTGGIRIPGLQKVDKLYLGQLSVDIKANSIPTHDFINVNVDAVAKVRVNPVMIEIAAANFLGKDADDIAREIRDSLEGNMREIVGTQELKSLNTDRDGFSNQIQEKAAVDMAKLGIEILTCNIQSITDENGLIEALGADNTCKITKEAQINKANADRDVRIAEAQAKREANDATVESETEIAKKNTELSVRVSELKIQSDTKKAVADAAYQIQTQEQLKTINEKTVEAEIAKAAKEQSLKDQEILIREKNLKATINKTADAEKYKIETEASAALEQRKRSAEAATYEAQRKAEAVKAEADACLYAAQMEAKGIEAKGKAEAAAIRARGEAEASAMDKKAEAYKKYNGAAMAEMMIKVLPEIAEKVAQPLSAIDKIQVYGTSGSEAAGISGNVPIIMRQTLETIKTATGVDLGEIMTNNSKVIAANAEVKKD